MVFPWVPATTIERAPVADLAVEDLFELGIAARDRVADDHQIQIRGDVLRLVAGQDPDPFGGEEIAHRRIDVLIGAPDV